MLEDKVRTHAATIVKKNGSDIKSMTMIWMKSDFNPTKSLGNNEN